jgi:hypothetical protein
LIIEIPGLMGAFDKCVLNLRNQRMKYLKLYIVFAGLPAFFQPCFGQQDSSGVIPKYTIPIGRQGIHEELDKQQKTILESDGTIDKQFKVSNNEEINFLVTQSLVNKIDWLQYNIEKDTLLNQQKRVRYVKGITNLLKNFYRDWRTGKLNGAFLPSIVSSYEKGINLDKKSLSVEQLIAELPFETANAIYKSGALDLNAGFAKSKQVMLYKYCLQNPDQTFKTLRENPDLPLADSLIRTAGYRYPNLLYDYAGGNNKLANMIRNMDEPLVKTVSKMAGSKSGQQYFPFLDDLVKGKIDAAKDDSIKNYKLLVKTYLGYVQRAINRDTAFGFKDINKRIEKKADEVFINTINGLHDLDDLNVRFRVIQSLTAEELYFLVVSTDGTMYTSSYVKGVYPLMMKKINNRADSLLMSVLFDKYRKFIKVAAGYNTLSNFLAGFPVEGDAKKLMKAFVSNLEKSASEEDGVDVADSYASIMETNKPLANEMLKLVKANYDRNFNDNNRRGVLTYNLLYKLFLSADSVNHIDLTAEFGIPSVYGLTNKDLQNDSSRIVMQVFFYGDKDGQGIFNGFLNMFNPTVWKKDLSNEQWVSIKSITGTPVSIYANRALPEEGGFDEKAQLALGEFLKKNKLNPTITIHRGHSYFANATIEQMSSTSKIVFMGSCGGYHLLHDIYKISPDAHIIASKQIGKTVVNRPFFDLLMEKLRTGKNIDWIPFWRELKTRANVEGFEDYIPPYKNLGAIYIKAYKLAMEKEGLAIAAN